VTTDPMAIVDMLGEVFVSPNESDRNGEPTNVVDGLFAIARALTAIAHNLDRLGTNGASSPMGAVEFLACEVKSGLDRLGELASAADRIADAIEGVGVHTQE
jgi:hypothetical protein